LIDLVLLRTGEVRPRCTGSRHVAARQQIANRLFVGFLRHIGGIDTVEGPVLTDQNDHVLDRRGGVAAAAIIGRNRDPARQQHTESGAERR
jgi:hypothetical protein